MKGFEVTFRGKISNVALNKYLIISIMVEKIDDRLRFSFRGFSDTNLSYVWDYAEDLKIGDEIIVKQKEIEENSEPLHVSNLFESTLAEGDIEPKSPELIAVEMRKRKLDSFYFLENKLKEAGLMQKLIDGQENITVPDKESRTNVEPLTTTIHAEQGDLSENETPKGLLPP
jgi:intein/homing endonuclease